MSTTIRILLALLVLAVIGTVLYMRRRKKEEESVEVPPNGNGTALFTPPPPPPTPDLTLERDVPDTPVDYVRDNSAPDGYMTFDPTVLADTDAELLMGYDTSATNSDAKDYKALIDIGSGYLPNGDPNIIVKTGDIIRGVIDTYLILDESKEGIIFENDLGKVFIGEEYLREYVPLVLGEREHAIGIVAEDKNETNNLIVYLAEPRPPIGIIIAGDRIRLIDVGKYSGLNRVRAVDIDDDNNLEAIHLSNARVTTINPTNRAWEGTGIIKIKRRAADAAADAAAAVAEAVRTGLHTVGIVSERKDEVNNLIVYLAFPRPPVETMKINNRIRLKNMGKYTGIYNIRHIWGDEGYNLKAIHLKAQVTVNNPINKTWEGTGIIKIRTY